MTATENPTLPAEAEPYIAAVRSLLWSLPSDERDELLDDLSAHLAELAAEPGPPLTERLGKPSGYASEFVTSAGVSVGESNDVTQRVRNALRLSPAMRARLEELRPAWWVLRPFIVVIAAVELLNAGFLNREGGAAELVVVTLIAAAAIGASTRIGREQPRWDRVLTLAGVVGALVILNALNQGAQYVYVDNTGYGSPGVLTRGDGSSVSNIWAYDRDGTPIDVFLFDQGGRPIDDVGTDTYDERTGEQLHTEVRTDAGGSPVPNLYPRQQTRERYDANGYPTRQRDRAPAFATPQLEAEPEVTTTTMPTSTSTTASPFTTTTVTTAPAGPPSTP